MHQSCIKSKIMERLHKNKKPTFSLVKGTGYSPYRLNSFDNALTDAGIGDVNLIKVSSMLAPHSVKVPLPELPIGSMINCVLSRVHSNTIGDKITSCVAVATHDQLGCAVGSNNINRDKDEIMLEALNMLKIMTNQRGIEPTNIYYCINEHIVEEDVDNCVISALIYNP